MKIHTAIDRYVEHMKARGYATRTCEGYSDALRCFADWVDKRGVVQVADIDVPLIQGYQDALVHHVGARGLLHLTTQAFRLQVVRQLLAFLVSRGQILINPAQHIPLPRVPPRPVLFDLPTVAEIEKILTAPDPTTLLGVRDRALLEVLYASGLRRSELVRLSVGDIDLVGGTIAIRKGKGGRGRLIPLGQEACRWVARYLAEVRIRWAGCLSGHALFLSRTGKPLCSRAFLRAIKTYARKAGIKKRVYIHLFRHACASHMLEGGADLRSLQVLLGHQRLATIAVYTHPDLANLKKVHRRCHPRAQDRSDFVSGEDPAPPARRRLPKAGR